MKLGISTALCTESPTKWAEAHKELGCKSVVFPLDSFADEETILQYKKAASDNNLMIAEVGIWRNAISPDVKEATANLEYSINQLILADKLNARCCVNVAGAIGPVWDGGYRDNFSKETFKKTVKMIQTVIDEAKPANTFFTIEPMPWMIPTGPEEYLKLIDAVERDRFGVHMDIINMINCPERYFFHEEFMDKTFELLGPMIRSCHIKDVILSEDFTMQLKECAPGKGTINLERYVRNIDAVDSDMPVIIEHLKDNDEYIKSFKYVSNRLLNGN